MEEKSENYHLIAISNLSDPDRQLQRWWCKKYQMPPRQLEDYTSEELFIEMLEDYYADKPDEIDKFTEGLDEWDGEMSVEYDQQIKKWRERSKDKNLLAKYDSDVELTEEEEKELINNIGKKLIPSDEFEEQF